MAGRVLDGVDPDNQRFTPPLREDGAVLAFLIGAGLVAVAGLGFVGVAVWTAYGDAPAAPAPDATGRQAVRTDAGARGDAGTDPTPDTAGTVATRVDDGGAAPSTGAFAPGHVVLPEGSEPLISTDWRDRLGAWSMERGDVATHCPADTAFCTLELLPGPQGVYTRIVSPQLAHGGDAFVLAFAFQGHTRYGDTDVGYELTLDDGQTLGGSITGGTIDNAGTDLSVPGHETTVFGHWEDVGRWYTYRLWMDLDAPAVQAELVDDRGSVLAASEPLTLPGEPGQPARLRFWTVAWSDAGLAVYPIGPVTLAAVPAGAVQ